ncbi:hypothetical protein L228DRAFT_269894 [Xylona heveae TC161]|uniref:Polycomb protein VEFS-Box domain-containing protein n=1 Tax=Xylona heveae (strain CBS 132557 / TC161) TaxID=1328760 RepID=A0A165AJQ8_XYLHT|nr:hypothetical protein L228DRAFT_269894 [Xylona heveae TC161]KZF20592.1 hypothetical protein L228DRAFT_269894 [Xylona heveae TC161]
MVDQQEREFRRKFAGNAAFYADLDEHRQQTFLQRNLRTVFRSHAQQLTRKAEPAYKIEDEDTIKVDQSGATGAKKPKWTLPSREILDDVNFRKTERVLKIDLKGIVMKELTKDTVENASAWRTDLKSEIPCHVQLRIVDSTGSKEKTVVRDATTGTIGGLDKEIGSDGLQIQLDTPFYINVEKLFVNVEKNKRRRMSAASSYSMVLVLSPMDSSTWFEQDSRRLKDALKSLLRYTESEQRNATAKTKDIQAFYAKWPNLLQCPQDGALLETCRYKDAKPISDCGILVDMGWNKQKTPLERYNSFLRDSPAIRFPTPVSDRASEASKVEVTYVFGDWVSSTDGFRMKEWSVPGYHCPFCHGKNLTSFEHLSFHLRNSHALFKFDLEHVVNLEAPDNQANVSVKVNIHDDLRETLINTPAYLEDLDWQRPRRPFDLKKYLEGDHSWVGGSQTPLRSLKRASTRRPSRTTASRGMSSTPSGLQDDEVPEIPPKRRKKYVVPPAPDPSIRFFRTTSKRMLNEGEEISESDDDVDEAWLIHKHDEVIDDFIDVSDPEKEFIKRWDAHMLEEGLSGNIHFADAMVRFVRANKLWLCTTERFVEFSKICAKLKLSGTIGGAVILRCVRIIHEEANAQGKDISLGAAQQAPDVTESPLSRRNLRLGQYHLRSSKEKTTPGLSQSPAPNGVKQELDGTPAGPDALSNDNRPARTRSAYGECICGKTIKDFHTAIICSQPGCLQPDFHLVCAGLENREPGWLCSYCSSKRRPPE